MDKAGLKGCEVYSWIGVMGPAGLPQATVSRLLHAEVVKTLQFADVRQRLTNLGVDVIGNSPDEFARIMEADLVKFGKIVKASGAKLD